MVQINVQKTGTLTWAHQKSYRPPMTSKPAEAGYFSAIRPALLARTLESGVVESCGNTIPISHSR